MKQVPLEEVKRAVKAINGSPQVKMGVLANKSLRKNLDTVDDFLKTSTESIEKGARAIEELESLKKNIVALFDIAPVFNPEAQLSSKEWAKVEKLKETVLASCRDGLV